jgi:hypothetical protein
MMRVKLSVVVLASTALLVAGCGGGSSSTGVARLPSSAAGDSAADAGGKSSTPESSASAQQKMVAFSQCMRTHGVPEFPEPTEGRLLIHRSDHNGHVTGVDPQSSQFQAAEKACKALAPPRQAPSPALQAKLQEGALKFSQCMRTHGVPDFPDPKFGGGGQVSLRVQGGPGGIDPNSPQFEAAQKTCQSDMPRPPGAKGAPGGGEVSSSGGSGGPGGGSAGQAVAAP